MSFIIPARVSAVIDRGADGRYCRDCSDPDHGAVGPCRHASRAPFSGTAAVRRVRATRFVDRDLTRNPD